MRQIQFLGLVDVQVVQELESFDDQWTTLFAVSHVRVHLKFQKTQWADQNRNEFISIYQKRISRSRLNAQGK